MKFTPAAGAVLAAFLTCATQARATVYNWTYGGDGTHSGSGTLTTAGSSSPFTVTAITGTFDGSPIDQLLGTGMCCAAPGNDNLLYSPPGSLLDINGIAFSTLTTSDDFDFNIVFLSSTNAYSVDDLNGTLTFFGTFTATPQPGSLPGSSVPEPASAGIVVAGLACLAAFFGRGRIPRTVR